MGKIKIESGVEIPRPNHRGKWKNLVKEMRVGDSVLVDGQSPRLSLVAALKKAGFKGVSRQTDGGIRVWKTKA